MAEVKVLLFGPLAEAFGTSESIHEIDESCTPEILLTQMGLSEWIKKGLRCAINQKICDLNKVIREGDELVFLTPVSGG
jgi:molybdopterin converting factor small subunit